MNNRNQKMIDAVIEKAEKVCPGSLALIGVYGSVATGDEYAKSDLDLLILIQDDNGWQLGTAFILDDNNSLWFVEQFDKSYDNPKATDDKAYIDIMDKCKKSKKTNKGKAIELRDIYIQQETRKYYICKYTNSRGYIEQIKILKAYEDIKEIIKK